VVSTLRASASTSSMWPSGINTAPEGVGEHVLAGHHAYALEDYWNIWLKRRKLSPPQRVASPEQ
jgi:hypothetical protein